MNRLFLAFALLLLPATAPAQELQKGNVVGTHVIEIQLAQGVSMEQYARAWAEKMLPALEENMPGWKCYLLKRMRGEQADGLGMIIVTRSEAERDKYFNADGSHSDLRKAVTARLAPITAEMDELGRMTHDRYTDWLAY